MWVYEIRGGGGMERSVGVGVGERDRGTEGQRDRG